MTIQTEWNTTLTIASGQTASSAFWFSADSKPMHLLIIAPETLPETVKLAVERQADESYATLQSGGSDITIAADKAVIVSPVMGRKMRLEAGTAVAANRAFEIYGIPIQDT